MRLTTLTGLLRGTLVALAIVVACSAVAAQAQLPPEGPSDFRHALSGGGVAMLSFLRHPTADSGIVVPPQSTRSTGVGTPAPPGLDLIVNDPTLDTPEATTQSEPALAVLGSTICAGYNNTRTGPIPNPLSGFARSTDRGSTWTDRGTTGRFRFSDPVLAVHRASRTFYYADIAFRDSATIIGVSRSTDECTTFPALTNASPSSASDEMQDKPWMAVDNSGGPHDGNVYVCWTRFGGDNSLHFSRSTDNATTFIDEQVIAPSTGVSPFGCHVEVGSSGEVYVAWSDRGTNFPIHFRRSLDGGLTWDPVVQVNTAPIRQPGMDRMVVCESGLIRPTLNGDIRMLPQAWMAVDTTGGPFNGNIYIVWASDPPGDVDNSDIFMSHSSDGGGTWSPEVQIGSGTVTDQFLPNVEVGGTGVVSVVWYDRRNDPANNFNIDVYTTFSFDGGATIEPIVRVSDVSFPVPPITGQPTASGNFDPGRSACYMGDYIGITADADYFYYAWGDNRNTVVSATYPDGRPDPDTFFERRLILCGDGITGPLEQCDDGNQIDGDGCDSNCTRTGCGNGIVTDGELCDDGNLRDGDGCNSDCMIGPTFTPTPSPSATPTTTVAPTLTPTPQSICPGDCNGDDAVTVDELIAAVNVALGNSAVTACLNADANGDGTVTVDEIIRGVNAALNGCSAGGAASQRVVDRTDELVDRDYQVAVGVE
jgi:cysteine-rich repeat protein